MARSRTLPLALLLAAPFAAAHGEVYTYGQIPPAIRARFEALAGPFDTVDAVHDTEMGHDTFQLTARRGERTHSAIFAFDGSLLVEQVDVEAATLPAAVFDALERGHLGARVLAAQRVTNFVTEPDHVAYRLTIVEAGLESDVWIEAAGTVENVHVNFATSTPAAASAEIRRLRARQTAPDVH